MFPDEGKLREFVESKAILNEVSQSLSQRCLVFLLISVSDILMVHISHRAPLLKVANV